MDYKINTKRELEEFISNHWNDVNKYIDDEVKKIIVPLYTSVDIREDAHKICPVDNNLYPAGFNNICSKDRANAVKIFEKALKTIKSDAKIIGILPESNTRNLFYLESLYSLGECIKNAGFEIYFISPDATLFNENKFIELESQSAKKIKIYHVEEIEGKFQMSELPNSKFDIIVLNHDQSTPFKIDWKKFKTPVVPSPLLGWYARQKNRHFSLYNEVITKFGANFGINPCLMQAKFKTVSDIDFESKEGLDRLGKSVDELKSSLSPDSKIFVKASKGTYGMGISVVSSGDEIIKMNRKTRNKMDVGKSNIKFTDILIQEGIETIIKYDGMPAEVTIYLVGGHCIGGFMRANSEKGTLDNLNSKGMVFKKFCVCEIKETADDKSMEAVYSVVARLSNLATGLELNDVL